MHTVIPRRPLIFLATLCALVLALGAIGAYAHGGNTALVHSCVQNASGSVRIVGPNDTCRSNETPLDWPKTVSVVALRQSYPISDATGVIAFGTTAIGWQAASADFQNTVAAFAICQALDGTINYRMAQAIGLARAFCLADEKVTGGGGFVETP